MRLAGRLSTRFLASAIALVIAGTVVRGEAAVRRLAERGPPTLVVGGLFTLMSPALMVVTVPA